MLLLKIKSRWPCNGKKRLMPYIIEVNIMRGPAPGQIAFIPRIPLVPMHLPFAFKTTVSRMAKYNLLSCEKNLGRNWSRSESNKISIVVFTEFLMTEENIPWLTKQKKLLKF